MTWLIVTILAYLILAVVFLVDKYLLVGPIPDPKVYAFYVGILGAAVLLLVPFLNFYLPSLSDAALSFVSGASSILAIFWFFKGLKLFEPSRIVPAVGGILPIFTFFIIFIISGGKETLGFFGFLAFVFLVLGTFLITFEKAKRISLESLKISIVAAFFFAVSFVSAKYVYLSHPFLVSLVWIKVGGALADLLFILNEQMRKGLFKEKISFEKKTAAIFLSGQAAGAGANILQNWAVALAPLAFVAVINALQGVQYVFLLIFTVFISLVCPLWAGRVGLKEGVSKGVVFQKISAIFLIGLGLALLAL
jgi:drug/metabolite transporter (DMT)-like permease